MKKFHYLVFFLAFLGVFLSGYFLSQRTGSRNEGAPAGRRILYYVDPMNPSHTSDKPGLAPCGMNLEPVYADEAGGGQAYGNRSSSMPPGTVRISPEKQQIIGVQLSPAVVMSESHTLRVLGRVAADENRIYRVLAPTDGYMGDLQTDVRTGSVVQKDQLLASYFSTEPLAAQQAYLLALRTMDRRRTDPAFEEQTGLRGESIDAQLRQAEENLKLVGIGETQIREIARTRQIIKSIEQRAPTSGLVTSRNIFPNSRFERNTEFFRIEDLSEVWIFADVFENEEQYIKPRTVARVSLPGRDQVFQAKVSDALPQFDINTRTYKVRLDLSNPGWLLRPGAFVDVEFALQSEPALAVPVEAVLDSGLKKTVFVDNGNGFFEPRTVKTGWSFGGRVEIVEGLEPGEKIVVSGNFLIDSESRMKLAASGMTMPGEVDPVCGLAVSPGKAKPAGLTVEAGGKTHFFCSPECKEHFKKDQKQPPEKSTAVEGQPVAPDARAGETRKETAPQGFVKDPVCSMPISSSRAKAAGLEIEYGGNTYYFCSPQCKGHFIKRPERYAEKAAPGIARQAVAAQGERRHD